MMTAVRLASRSCLVALSLLCGVLLLPIPCGCCAPAALLLAASSSAAATSGGAVGFRGGAGSSSSCAAAAAASARSRSAEDLPSCDPRQRPPSRVVGARRQRTPPTRAFPADRLGHAAAVAAQSSRLTRQPAPRAPELHACTVPISSVFEALRAVYAHRCALVLLLCRTTFLLQPVIQTKAAPIQGTFDSWVHRSSHGFHQEQDQRSVLGGADPETRAGASRPGQSRLP